MIARATDLPPLEQGFSGCPRTDWLNDGRSMMLVEDFHYTAKSGVTYTAPAGFVIDGKTVPRLLWGTWLARSPFTGKERDASIIHDYICLQADELNAPKLRKFADELWEEMIEFLGVKHSRIHALYRGVRLGALWSQLKGVYAKMV